MSSSTESNIYNISRLNSEIKRLLEGNFGRVWVNAEISNFVAASSGHWYFTLKDARSQIKCAMFKGKNRSVSFLPKNGQQIMVRANISVYEPRGDYQLLVDMMDMAGDGALQQQFEQLKCELAAKGLFSSEAKKPLPSHPKKIGVITSPTGAALTDVLSVLKRRNPLVDVIIYPSQVQGKFAATELINALQTANARNEVELLILTRGGGSLEDLWCFNDAQLAQVIYDSSLPIISAVGHEIDVTIGDFVADYRAPTPSAAAEIAVTSTQEQARRLVQLSQQLAGQMSDKLHKQRHQLQGLYTRLVTQDPKYKLQQQAQYLDELTSRMVTATNNNIHASLNKLMQLKQAMAQHNPQSLLTQHSERQHQLLIRLKRAISNLQETKQAKLHSLMREINSVSPLATLERGYSISYDNKGAVLKTSAQVDVGATITSQLSTGSIESTVTAINQ